jgi:hypothetical protein
MKTPSADKIMPAFCFLLKISTLFFFASEQQDYFASEDL